MEKRPFSRIATDGANRRNHPRRLGKSAWTYGLNLCETTQEAYPKQPRAWRLFPLADQASRAHLQPRLRTRQPCRFPTPFRWPPAVLPRHWSLWTGCLVFHWIRLSFPWRKRRKICGWGLPPAPGIAGRFRGRSLPGLGTAQGGGRQRKRGQGFRR